MLFHRRENTEIALDTPIVIVTNIISDHINQLFLAGKTFAVITFPLQDPPESFHWTVVNALGHTRHALLHTSFLQLVMEGSVGILKASVAVEQGMSDGIGFYGPVKGLENQRIVISVTYHIGNNTTVIEIKNRTEIYLVYLDACIPFELCYISQPLLIWFVCMEVAVKEVFSYILRILCSPCAAVVVVLDGGLDAFGPTDAENALVVNVDVLIVS